ncbi:hypothetical protein N5T78_10315 [Aliarcobacter cryaerophilus]|uniref:hypothetical protein n=1 Tax=Aliarcobacter cryaerophilus TaxID=28198 RepID=UPI0021B64D04|nr:hypothetical protein [Aliarcobacter cryaerophilus]MCT7466975.1 hypothetical protein [Aliarcobacter cryaerophilus]
MVLLKKFYDENKEKFNMSYESVLNYIKRGLVEKGIKIVNNEKRNSYYVSDKDLFLANFK